MAHSNGLAGSLYWTKWLSTIGILIQEINKASHSTKYIPNLDDIDNKQKQDILSKIYNIDLKDKSNEEIEMLFRKVMKKEIINIEKDIQNIS